MIAFDALISILLRCVIITRELLSASTSAGFPRAFRAHLFLPISPITARQHVARPPLSGHFVAVKSIDYGMTLKYYCAAVFRHFYILKSLYIDTRKAFRLRSASSIARSLTASSRRRGRLDYISKLPCAKASSHGQPHGRLLDDITIDYRGSARCFIFSLHAASAPPYFLYKPRAGCRAALLPAFKGLAAPRRRRARVSYGSREEAFEHA